MGPKPAVLGQKTGIITSDKFGERECSTHSVAWDIAHHFLFLSCWDSVWLMERSEKVFSFLFGLGCLGFFFYLGFVCWLVWVFSLLTCSALLSKTKEDMTWDRANHAVHFEVSVPAPTSRLARRLGFCICHRFPWQASVCWLCSPSESTVYADLIGVTCLPS